MKQSNKSSTITGIVLLVLAALFSFSLILKLLDFGIGGPGHNNFMFLLGNMLYTVYGFSSILIPTFLLIAAFSCFASKWTSQKTMRLITALLPFFTAVVTEKICRSVAAQSSGNATVKIIITLITGLMLIVIEILGAGIIAENVNRRLFKNSAKKSNDFQAPEYEEEEEIPEEESQAFKAEPIRTVQKKSIFDKVLSQIKPKDDGKISEIPEEVSIDDVKEEISAQQVKDFENSLSEEDDDSFNELKQESDDLWNEETSAEDIPSIEDYENLDKPTESEEISSDEIDEASVKAEEAAPEETVAENNVPAEENAEIEEETFPDFGDSFETEKTVETSSESVVEESDVPAAETPAEEPEEKIEEEIEEKNPASIITQEEYAALINTMAEPETETADNDELEWNNLPPVSNTLPPEYVDDFDLDDPALEFPPKEEAPAEEEAFIDLTVPMKKSASASTQTQAQPQPQVQRAPTQPAQTYANESPYASAKYIDDAVRENPAYPIGISLHEQTAPVQTAPKPVQQPVTKAPVRISLDESQIPANQAQEDANVPPALAKNTVVRNDNGEKFSRGISFDDFDFEEEETEKPVGQYTTTPQVEDDSDADTDDYKEDVTLPEPDFGEDVVSEFEVGSPAVEEDDFEEFLQQNFEDVSAKKEDDTALDPDFFDVDMNADEEEVQPDFSDDIPETPHEEATQVFQQIRTQEEKQGLTAAAHSVFSDMEEDIMAEQPDDDFQAEETYVEENEVTAEDYDNDDDKTLNPNAGHATNLTADELTDFFNAQQKENTPKTKTIEPNPPKIGNRAVKKGPYVIPSDLLTAYEDDQYWIIDEDTKQSAINLKQTLAEFNIEADVIGIKKGPVVTMFELLPAPGVKLSKIVALQDNIALSLAAQSVRIVAPIPGKQAVGIEVPNRHRSVVGFREIIEMDLPEWKKMAVPVILGKDILGKAQLIDLTKTPHMLIAGATGSGKSVCVNSLILSILFKRSYKDVKMILVDPKVVELKLYNNIPHLLTPVITEPKKALQALQYCLCEMERRYALLDGLGVRDISTYNQRIKERNICTEKLPYIVVIIDEFADLMATSGKELESTVARLTAMSRAVGIHLVLATQRPSVNVITGLIKANIPSRIAFMVASRTDSNIIIDSVGAEKLLGRGDMLYASAVDPAPVRIQGTFVTDQEVEDVVNAVKEYGEPEYIDDEIFVETDDEEAARDLFGEPMDDEDPLYDQALEIVVQAGKASASYIQRRLKIGYNRAARLVEEMEERGIVGPANGSKPREVIHMP